MKLTFNEIITSIGKQFSSSNSLAVTCTAIRNMTKASSMQTGKQIPKGS